MDERIISSGKAVIYTGPSSPAQGLRHYTVYRDVLPEYIAAMIEDHDVAAEFFPTVEEFAAGAGDFSPNSPEWKAFSKILEKEA